ncbi:NUDIX hydrolase [Oceanobacillus neutriphilus]|uniref:DNA mismatch repair protein MutT n=1 Tax=Oceanobacillus neutriphilus TaxID=531815 RepID=A0ABQ2NXX7_9BACI|nr:NUDIX hydrolase [Oceanobacillus neutriphilus]GGP13281.1 DNA mismatch repair protein MutT [Oceanobacillus neutriphilus]
MAEYVKEIRELIGSRPFILAGSTIVAQNERAEILFQHRSDTKEWGLPGGAMEIGESLEQTAKRELYEETGLKAEVLKFVDILSGKDFYFKYPNGDEVYNVIAVYFAEGISGELQMNDGESIELRYFALPDIPSNLDERAKIIIEKYI